MPAANGQVMMLGSFVFSINTATYNTLNRSDEWRWRTIERLGSFNAEQFNGWGSTTITLEGEIYPLRNYGGVQNSGNITLTNGKIVGTNQLEAVRAMANTRQPQTLVDGAGKNYGQFVIVKLNEIQSMILDNGKPRKQEFRLELRSYGAYSTSQSITGPFQDLTLPALPSSPLVAQLGQSGQTSSANTLAGLVAAGATQGDGMTITNFLNNLNSANGGQLQAPVASPLAPTVANLNNPSNAAQAQIYTTKHEAELQAGADYIKQQEDLQAAINSSVNVFAY